MEKMFGHPELGKKRESEENVNTLSVWRSLPQGIRAFIVSIPLLYGASIGKKTLDHYDLKKAQMTIAEGYESKKPIKEKIEQIEQLIGSEYLQDMPGYHEFVELENSIESTRDDLQQRDENFSYVDAKVSLKREEFVSSRTRVGIENMETYGTMEKTKEFVASDMACSDGKLSKEVFTAIALQTYPEGWVQGEITSVNQKNVDDQSNGSYNMDRTWKTLASCKTYGEDGRSEITFFKRSLSKDAINNVMEFFTHETAHANDWNNNYSLSFKERLDFLLETVNRVQSDDRYHSPYVEHINNKNKKTELRDKTVEYWAEICAQYFGGTAQNLNYKDIQIIEKVIKKKDSKFNVKDAFDKRLNSVFYLISKGK